MRQAFAGMLWSKQLYYYDVAPLARRRPGPTDAARRRGGRPQRPLAHFNAFDIMSMPDKWEYPWFAAWDLAFHCVALAHVDPAFAKYQLTLLCREWFQHPNGALPAYEWDFGDVNPPVQAWAALEVFAIDGGRDIDFLVPGVRQAAGELHLVGEPARTPTAPTCSRAGSSGLDNIGPLDRSHLPPGQRAGAVRRHRVDGDLRAGDGGDRDDPAPRRAAARRRPGAEVPRALRRDPRRHRVRRACGTRPTGCSTTGWPSRTAAVVPVKVRSMVGIIPMLAAGVVDEAAAGPRAGGGQAVRRLPGPAADCATASSWPSSGLLRGEPGHRQMLLGVVGIDRLERLFEKLFDPAEFLSPYGLRALSAYHREHPYVLEAPGMRADDRLRARGVDHRRCSAATPTGAGPVWFPLNYLVVAALERYHRFFGDDYTVEYPTGSGADGCRWTPSPRTCGTG